MSKIITASKLNRLWKNGVLNVKSTLEGLINTELERIDDVEENVSNKLPTYADVMANTVEGYLPDALAVKEGFNQVNDSLGWKLISSVDVSLSGEEISTICIIPSDAKEILIMAHVHNVAESSVYPAKIALQEGAVWYLRSTSIGNTTYAYYNSVNKTLGAKNCGAYLWYR